MHFAAQMPHPATPLLTMTTLIPPSTLPIDSGPTTAPQPKPVNLMTQCNPIIGYPTQCTSRSVDVTVDHGSEYVKTSAL